jgi:hypothetical protein
MPEAIAERGRERGQGIGRLTHIRARRHRMAGLGAVGEGSEGAMVRASRPSTAASAVVMNAGNSPGTRSW